MEKEDAIQIFTSAINAVHPAKLLNEHLAVNGQELSIGRQHFLRSSFQHIYVVGAGKAAAAMAVETEKILGDYLAGGLVTTKYGHGLSSTRIRIVEAAHPVPDERSVEAVTETLKFLKKAGKDDIIICLLSGGASALWCDLPQGVTLEDLQTLSDQLIKSGASIGEINAVRKHLSGIKGGQLIKHCGGAKVFTFIISDVPNDNLDIIASGPTVADTSTFQDAYQNLLKYNLFSPLPPGIQVHIEKGLQGVIADTPKPGDPLYIHTTNKIIGHNRMALQAAGENAVSLGYYIRIIDQVITGDAESEAKKLVSMAAAYSGIKPVCILQGGETTVKVSGKGKGGRNQHFVLAALNELCNMQKNNVFHEMTILSGGTDGTDGPTDAAGAIIDQGTVNMVWQEKISIEEYLKDFDAYHFFEKINGLLITGPTQTNVMDIMAVIIR